MISGSIGSSINSDAQSPKPSPQPKRPQTVRQSRSNITPTKSPEASLLMSNDKRKRANSYDSEKENQLIGDQLDRKAATPKSASQDCDMHVIRSDRSLEKGEPVAPKLGAAERTASTSAVLETAKEEDETCDFQVEALEMVGCSSCLTHVV